LNFSREIIASEAGLLKVGLTGGISSGKSVVGEMFAALGVAVIDADHIAHALMQPGQKVYEEVVQHFGVGVLNPDGTVNRSKLAEAAFGPSNQNAPSRVQELNRIVHPPVIRKQEEWMNEIARKQPQGIAMVEAALIVEAGAAKRFDRVIMVTCQPEQRFQRWANLRKVDQAAAAREVTRRMAAQLPDEEKIKVADYVIDNSGSLDNTQKQVKAVYEQLVRLAENS
jgi:dephospho-CoA kinase